MEITIKDIIEFVKKALLTDCSVEAYDCDNFALYITNNNRRINIYIANSWYNICGTKGEGLLVDYNLTEREKLSLQELVLCIRERNEKRAINLFNHFLDKEELTIDDIDEED